MAGKDFWRPPDFSRPGEGLPGRIQRTFSELYPSPEYDELAAEIGSYWIAKLAQVWKEKPSSIKARDRRYRPGDPLSRIQQHTVVIAYADSVQKKGEPTLTTLENFLGSHFPAVAGLHLLPACRLSEERFNDGGFSQIRRDQIHRRYGTNAQFEAMMNKYYSMADFVLNHVDIENDHFRRYLQGDDRAGRCFYVFTEAQYQQRALRGDFEAIFRPRPFPLFTIFRRNPPGVFAARSHRQRIAALKGQFSANGLDALPDEVLNILYIFDKIKNDQMLLEADYQHLTAFREYLRRSTRLSWEELFDISQTQETRHQAYIFKKAVATRREFLLKILPQLNIAAENAGRYADIYATHEASIFGEPIRALTTFSHVQVDLNTSTFEGLKLLIDDFAWYLKMDLNMLRLDAANFAFKKWGTSCFGLPEVRQLLKVLYLSMEAVSPRTVPNLEVNAPLGNILAQMCDKQAPPAMMYDFHLPSILPVVFNSGDSRPLFEIFKLIDRYDPPHESIRFSLDESHDGKSVSGSGGADPLLTYEQRAALVETVLKNRGHVKYKSSPKGRCPENEFKKICAESGLEFEAAQSALFSAKNTDNDMLRLKGDLKNPADIARALALPAGELQRNAALKFFTDKILNGREPYELCISTRDVLKKLDDPYLEARRYLAFKTLAMALMGRNVKAQFFNDLMGLPNNHELVEKTGELRSIKRTKSALHELEALVQEPSHVECWIAGQMNNLIALIDSDPAFSPRGSEARLGKVSGRPSVAVVHNQCRDHHTLVVVNLTDGAAPVSIDPRPYGLDPGRGLYEHIKAVPLPETPAGASLSLKLKAFGRCWIKNRRVKIARKKLVRVGTEVEMAAALGRRL